MAYSVEDDTYIALYGVWQDPADDDANVAWATERMREMEPLASGIQLADENLGRRPARFAGEENMARLDELRASSTTLTGSSILGWGGSERWQRAASRSDAYLARPMTPPEPAVLRGDRGRARSTRPTRCRSRELDRLLDPAPLTVETGWCTLPDGVGYVAVRTRDAGGHAAMVDWWFDWHPREPLRYRIWHPRGAPRQLGRAAAPCPGAKAHWGAVHHPVEDVGTGTVHARIAFVAPARLGFSERRARRPGAWRRSSAATSATTAAACATRRWRTSSCATATASCCAATSGSARRCVPTCRRRCAASAARC